MSDVPAWWREGQDREKQNRRSREQERNRAKATGGKVQAGSGSSWRAREDVKTPDYLEQLKFTDKKSFSLKLSEWKRIRDNAIKAGREPRMVVEFSGEQVTLIITEQPN